MVVSAMKRIENKLQNREEETLREIPMEFRRPENEMGVKLSTRLTSAHSGINSVIRVRVRSI